MSQRTWARGLTLPAIITTLVIALAACGQITTPQSQTRTNVHTQALTWTITNVAPMNADCNNRMNTSLALDSSGNPHISYINFPDGTCSWQDVGKLMYVSYDGSNWTTPEEVASGVNHYSSLAFDAGWFPHISYYSSTTGNLMFASFNGTSWSPPDTVAAGNVDNEKLEGESSSLAFDANHQPHIAYWEDHGGYDGTWSLKYASYDGGWTSTTVDSSSSSDVGESPSLTFDSQHHPRISYTAVVAVPSTSYSRYALKYASNDGSEWTTPTTLVDPNPLSSWTLADGDYGEQSSLAFDGQGNPHISAYGDETGLRYSSYDNTNGWSTVVLDSSEYAGLDSSLAFDSQGHAHISYAEASNGALKYAWYDGSSWHVDTLATEGPWDIRLTSLAIDSSGNVYISYYDRADKELKVAYGAAATPSASITSFQASPNPVVVMNPTTFTWDITGANDSDSCTLDPGDGSTAITIPDCANNETLSHTYTSYNSSPYTATLTIDGTSTSEPTSVTVLPPPPVISSFSSAPTSLPSGGGDVTLSWGAINWQSFTVSVSPLITGFPTTTDGTSVGATLPANSTSTDITYEFTLTVKGLDGSNNTTRAVNVVVRSPEHSIRDLITSVDSLGTLKAGQANGLTHPLNNALRSLDKDHFDDVYNQLQDFISDVQAKTPTPIGTQDADTLIGTAESIESSLGY